MHAPQTPTSFSSEGQTARFITRAADTLPRHSACNNRQPFSCPAHALSFINRLRHHAAPSRRELTSPEGQRFCFLRTDFSVYLRSRTPPVAQSKTKSFAFSLRTLFQNTGLCRSFDKHGVGQCLQGPRETLRNIPPCRGERRELQRALKCLTQAASLS